MTRDPSTYRGARRNAMRAVVEWVDGRKKIIVPRKQWSGVQPTKCLDHPPVRPNRSKHWKDQTWIDAPSFEWLQWRQSPLYQPGSR